MSLNRKKETQQSRVAAALLALALHYCHLGACSKFPNLFIYPPDYVKADAPRNNQSGEMICTVRINMEIWAINEISLEKQDILVDLTLTVRWADNRLTVNPNISSKNLFPVMDKNEIKQIWTPTLLFLNCKGCSPVSVYKSEELSVSKASGEIVARIRALQRFNCAIDLRAYPMDVQFCQIQIYTYEDTEDAIRLTHRYLEREINVASNITLAEYHINPISKTNCIFTDSEYEVFSCLELRIRLQHFINYHLITSYAPTSFIVILSWISFWLPLNLSPARVALGLTSLLTLATRLDQAQKNLPPVAYAKAIDVWMFACIFLVSSSLLEFAVCHYQQEISKTKSSSESKKIKVLPAFNATEKRRGSKVFESRPPVSDHDANSAGTSLDHISRIIFPITFLIFNIVYWSYYLTYNN